MNQQEAGKDYIMRGLIISTPYQILLERLYEEGSDGPALERR
jgi:hypothetical protein